MREVRAWLPADMGELTTEEPASVPISHDSVDTSNDGREAGAGFAGGEVARYSTPT